MPGFFFDLLSAPSCGTAPGLLLQEPEFLVEAAYAAAAVNQLLATTGPGRVRRWIDILRQRVAFRAPGGAGLKGRALGHGDLDRVVVRMNIGLHGHSLNFAMPDRGLSVDPGRRAGACSVLPEFVAVLYRTRGLAASLVWGWCSHLQRPKR